MDFQPRKPEVETKGWGITRCIHESEGTLVFHASIKKDGYCSKHYHEGRVNDFYVVSGVLDVSIYPTAEADQPSEIYRLHAGQCLKIPVGVIHRFHALTDVELIETYWAVARMDDIVRYDLGGIMDSDLPPGFDPKDKPHLPSDTDWGKTAPVPLPEPQSLPSVERIHEPPRPDPT